jgi:probable F420-dependent oxidoreductase
MTFPTARSMPPAALGAELEQRGYESLWVPEHTHIPSSRESPWAGGPELPQYYYETLDPFLTLAAVATATRTLRLGTAVALAVQRDPIQLAKEVATLDVISGGRVELGVGPGWNLEEMRDHGTDPARRFRLLRERVEAMKEIWTQEEAEYHGELVDFGPMRAWPKPVQQPHPPIHIGGPAGSAFKRVIRYGDGWLPLWARDQGDYPALTRQLREAAAEAGRDPAGIQVTVCYVPADERVIAQLDKGGIDRVVFAAPSAPAPEILDRLDTLQPVAAPYLS